MSAALFGVPVIVSEHAVAAPSPGEWARRFVRHGMADVLAWLGEDVGPRPDGKVPATFVIHNPDRQIIAHPAIVHALRQAAYR